MDINKKAGHPGAAFNEGSHREDFRKEDPGFFPENPISLDENLNTESSMYSGDYLNEAPPLEFSKQT